VGDSLRMAHRMRRVGAGPAGRVDTGAVPTREEADPRRAGESGEMEVHFLGQPEGLKRTNGGGCLWNG